MVQCNAILENGLKCPVKNSCWNFPNLKPGFCSQHADKENGMIDVKNKKCIGVNGSICKKRNSFGFPGGDALYCSPCGKKISPLIIQIYKNYCKYIGCKHVPVFNYEGQKKGKYCFKHKELIMINVIGRRCPGEDCDAINPTYDFPGGSGTFCQKHCEEGMINVRINKCIVCNTQTAVYRFPNEKLTHCSTHKLDNMLYLKNKCELCDVECLYGRPLNPISRCFQHREKGMIKRSNAKCQTCNVNLSTYGFNFTAFRCENCKLESDENLTERKCKLCNLDMVLNKDEICEFCDPEIFQRCILAKQNALKLALETNELKISSVDRIIDNGYCGKERPDFVFDFEKYIIILECDEHQHKDRQLTCETTRMINITQSYGGIQVYFIRWNPDDYKPFDKNKKMIPINTRHKTVANFIKSIQNGEYNLPTDNLASCLYMYYDGWNTLEDSNWISIQKLEK
jgi:hypothetical protein